jgi:hypothetical protein
MKSRSIAGLSGLAAAVCAAVGAGEPDVAVAAAVSAAAVLLVAGLASVRVDADRAALVAATAGGVTAGASGSGARVNGAGAAAAEVGVAAADVAAATGAGLKGTGFSGSRGADGLMGVGSRETGVAAVAGVFVGLADEEEEGLEMGRGALAEGFEPAGTRAAAAAEGPCALGALAGRTERDANEDGGESGEDRAPELIALELGAAVAAEVLPGIAAPVGTVLLFDAAGVDAEAAALD